MFATRDLGGGPCVGFFAGGSWDAVAVFEICTRTVAYTHTRARYLYSISHDASIITAIGLVPDGGIMHTVLQSHSKRGCMMASPVSLTGEALKVDAPVCWLQCSMCDSLLPLGLALQ